MEDSARGSTFVNCIKSTKDMQDFHSGTDVNRDVSTYCELQVVQLNLSLAVTYQTMLRLSSLLSTVLAFCP